MQGAAVRCSRSLLEANENSSWESRSLMSLFPILTTQKAFSSVSRTTTPQSKRPQFAMWL